jgi:hypothetical protein
MSFMEMKFGLVHDLQPIEQSDDLSVRKQVLGFTQTLTREGTWLGELELFIIQHIVHV